MRLPVCWGWGLLLCALALPACGGENAPSPAAPAEPAVEAPPGAPPSVPAAAPAPSRRKERPLPAFTGFSLDGRRIAVSEFLGKRLVLFFFNPEVPGAGAVADGVRAVAGLRGEHNFEILGIGVGSRRQRLEEFVGAHELPFPVIDDSGAAITRQLGLQSPLLLGGVDAEGYLTFGLSQFPEGSDAGTQVEAQLRSQLRLPPAGAETAPRLGTRPPAPDFAGSPLDGSGTFRLSEQRGRPVVLVFFLHTCPHCHHALAFLKEALAALPENLRPVPVGIEVTGRTAAVRGELQRRGLDFLPVLFDDDHSIRSAYGVFAGVPEIFLIDSEGYIAARESGWEEGRQPPLMRMRLARLAGAPVPMLLRGQGYSGSEVCGVCHEREFETWSLTTHATAFATLVEHGEERNAECVGCHVVGWGHAGGYTDPVETPDLENVGCESCHGRGGPHLSPGTPGEAGYASVCATCHDTKHSLGFDFATFLPKVSHAANAHLADLPLAEKQKLLAERGRLRQDVLPGHAAYVGSEACRSCHAAEYATWALGGHARAFATLEAQGQAGNADCQKCHTTGFGRPGGFPAAGGSSGTHTDLARVGCESCHGPGGDHVPPDAPKTGSIVSLGDKCDSCVILQICGGCHDDANDPGFEFEVQEKIEKQRHGTIEPSGGPAPGRSASLPVEG